MNRGIYYPSRAGNNATYPAADAYLDVLFEFEKNGELTDRSTRALYSIVMDLNARLKDAVNRIAELERKDAQ